MSFDFKKYFDYIICADILEHLSDPWVILNKIHKWLKDDGKIIVTLPNIRNYRILKDLVFLGKWEYKESGILDKTHLRFFTKSSFSKALSRADFEIIHSSY